MKNAHSPIQTSHKSAFDDLLQQQNKMPELSDEALLQSAAWPDYPFKFEALAYILPPKLKPNCLLLRYPLVLILKPWYQTPLPRQLAAKWLVWQLRRHGYQATCRRGGYGTTSLDQNKDFHLLTLNGGFDDKTKSPGFRSVTQLKSLDPHMNFQPTRPLTSLSSLLKRVNFLAEQDHR